MLLEQRLPRQQLLWSSRVHQQEHREEQQGQGERAKHKQDSSLLLFDVGQHLEQWVRERGWSMKRGKEVLVALHARLRVAHGASA